MEHGRAVYAYFQGKAVMVGVISNGVFRRTCKSDQLYKAMGGSLGVDDAVLKELEESGVKQLEVTVKDWGTTYAIALAKFKQLAKPRNFYGITRWHLPFHKYWSKVNSASAVTTS
ncbi:MAG TPA: hypothetical protein GXX52_02670 [Synergistaceae bacterium]|nr:hypothetical protein [Synergistaceae bacterium]